MPGEALVRTSVVETLAGALRRHIVSGALADGELLPKQDELLARYGVGRTTLRQALRILENEGLVTVRRGRLGGAVVHVPQAADAARVFGLVLQSRTVPLDDLGIALRRLEPVCAALCAERPDRHETVVPHLEAALEGAEAEADDVAAFLRGNRRFHEALVRHCGNETMQVLLGSIESLWSAQEPDWVQDPELVADIGDRLTAVRTHRAIVRHIAEGDDAAAYYLTRRHIEAAQSYLVRVAGARTVQILDPADGRPRI
ncbi:MAG: FadR family transcriptional regulator [Streptomycetaceae bacterium]|nr:FadR family transcriptional regulator [Streptomycetaceae bacterium]